MELFDLNQQLTKGTFPPIIILYGEEPAILKVYVDKIVSLAKEKGIERKDINSVSSFLDIDRGISLLGETNLYVCKYDYDFLDANKLWESLQKCGKNNYLILIYANLDKCERFKKVFDNILVKFSCCDDSIVKEMLRSGDAKYLSDDNLTLLVKGCSNNYTRCLNEFNKVLGYVESKKDIDRVFTGMYNKKLFCFDVDTNAFTFCNNVLKKNKDAYKQYIDIMLSGDSGLRLLSMLYGSFRNLFIVKTTNNPTPENTGLTQGVINMMKNYVWMYSGNDIINALNKINEIERGVKIGDYEEATAISFLLANIL